MADAHDAGRRGGLLSDLLARHAVRHRWYHTDQHPSRGNWCIYVDVIRVVGGMVAFRHASPYSGDHRRVPARVRTCLDGRCIARGLAREYICMTTYRTTEGRTIIRRRCFDAPRPNLHDFYLFFWNGLCRFLNQSLK